MVNAELLWGILSTSNFVLSCSLEYKWQGPGATYIKKLELKVGNM